MDGVVTEFPENVFRKGVFTQFCSATEKAKAELTWIVDSRGNQIPPIKSQRSLIFIARSPPPDPEIWKDYRIQLKWKPNLGGWGCQDNCQKAFAKIANSPCGHNGGQSNVMTQDISYDVGCGTYSVFIESPDNAKPKSGPPVTPSGCFTNQDFPGHGAIGGDMQLKLATETCKMQPEGDIDKESPFGVYHKWINNADYAFGICWDSVRQECQKEGLKDKRVGFYRCVELLHKAWKGCNNGGAGGWFDLGCVKYEFRPRRYFNLPDSLSGDSKR